jgi:hypothetical protein
MSSFKSRLPAIIACVYLLPGIWIIVSSYSCGAMMCDLVAIVYSALPVPFIKAFYIVGASIQGVSWWEPQWPLPGAPLVALSLICNTIVIYFAVIGVKRFFKRRVKGT